MTRRLRFVAVVSALGLSAAALSAQVTRPNARGGAQLPAAPAPDDAPGVSPAEIQRMFDGYALMQAEQFLKISDDQFARFLPRYKLLQDVRRQSLSQHARAVNELRRLINTPPIDEGQLRDRLKALADLDATNEAEVRKAFAALDQVLDVQQQARFRVFEENMERRKLDLVTRARQANRPKQ
jgi:Spy/CpxP family protein refolding chaperone